MGQYFSCKLFFGDSQLLMSKCTFVNTWHRTSKIKKKKVSKQCEWSVTLYVYKSSEQTLSLWARRDTESQKLNINP